MKKLLFSIVILIMAFVIIPNVSAEEVEYPEIENDLTSSSYKGGDAPVIVGSKTGTVTITVSNATYQLDEAKAGSGHDNRPANIAWVGLKFTMPEGATDVKIEGDLDARYTGTFTEWFGFDVAKLTAVGKNSYERTFTISWQDAEHQPQEQKFTLVVIPSTVTLLKMSQPSVEDWNEEHYLENTSQIKLTYHLVYENEELPMGAGTYFYLDKTSAAGQLATRLNLLQEEEIDPKYAVAGYYTDLTMTTEFDVTTITGNEGDIYIKLVNAKGVEEREEETTPGAKNPNTADINIGLLLGLITISGIGTAYTIKKRKFN